MGRSVEPRGARAAPRPPQPSPPQGPRGGAGPRRGAGSDGLRQRARGVGLRPVGVEVVCLRRRVLCGGGCCSAQGGVVVRGRGGGGRPRSGARVRAGEAQGEDAPAAAGAHPHPVPSPPWAAAPIPVADAATCCPRARGGGRHVSPTAGSRASRSSDAESGGGWARRHLDGAGLRELPRPVPAPRYGPDPRRRAVAYRAPGQVIRAAPEIPMRSGCGADSLMPAVPPPG